MADQQEAQAPNDTPVEEAILRALDLWDDKKTTDQNVAAARANGLGDWLDKPKEMLERLSSSIPYDPEKSVLENLATFKEAGVKALLMGVAVSIPVALIAYQEQVAPYANMPTLKAVAENPAVLVSSLSWVQKMRVSSALTTIAETPEGARLVGHLMDSGLSVDMNMRPNGAGGAVTWKWTPGNANIDVMATKISATGISSAGDLVAIITHELRHLEQVRTDAMSPFRGNIVSPESLVLYNRFVEADAQATATEVAWQLRQQGQPGAWESLKSNSENWIREIAGAYEEAAEAHPEAASDGSAKRAAFDKWFTAENADGTLVADVYNEQGVNNWPHRAVLNNAAEEGAAPSGAITPDVLARAGGNDGDNYLVNTEGPALNDPYYRRAGLNPAQEQQLQALNEEYATLRDRFNAAAPRRQADAEAIQTAEAEGMPVPDPEAVVSTVPTGLRGWATVNNTVDGAMGALGLAQGTMGVIREAREGDYLGVGVNGVNALSGGTALGLSVARGLGTQVPLGLQQFVGKANIYITVGTGLYQIYDEKGNLIDKETDGSYNLGNKGERAAAVLLTGGTAFGMAAAGFGSAGVVPTVVAVAYTADAAIDARRAWKETDRRIAHNGAPQRLDDPGDRKPDFHSYKHLFTEFVEVSAYMRDSALPFKPERDPKSSRILFNDARKFDLEDPKVQAEYARALDLMIHDMKNIMTANDSILPKWTRFDDGASAYTGAEMILADLQGAKTELGWYKEDIAAWNAASPATSSRFVSAQNAVEPVSADTSEKPTVVARVNTPPQGPRG
ncbi:MAG: DUF6782 family putative metallopeptidase [Alphaproteobacteria bacterium]